MFDPEGTNAPAGLCLPHWGRQVTEKCPENVSVFSVPGLHWGINRGLSVNKLRKQEIGSEYAFNKKRRQFFAIVEKIKIADLRVVTVEKKGTAL